MEKEQFSKSDFDFYRCSVEIVRKALIPIQFILLELAFIQFLLKSNLLAFIPKGIVEQRLSQVLEFTLNNGIIGFVVPVIIVFTLSSIFSLLYTKEIQPLNHLSWLGKCMIFLFFPVLAVIFDFGMIERALVDSIFYTAIVRFGLTLLLLTIINFLPSFKKKKYKK